ncbi:hypothetical protein F2Q70_00017771 [Brassica cretica]|uniref:Uncharacterized protein n=1 Tax=Brassica cretica TaxID=69181 RepID=A0A8S9HRW9_BRACR|nr:hypothetical protein F2Q70_00017771 [Brassica cretica]
MRRLIDSRFACGRFPPGSFRFEVRDLAPAYMTFPIQGLLERVAVELRFSDDHVYPPAGTIVSKVILPSSAFLAGLVCACVPLGRLFISPGRAAGIQDEKKEEPSSKDARPKSKSNPADHLATRGKTWPNHRGTSQADILGKRAGSGPRDLRSWPTLNDKWYDHEKTKRHAARELDSDQLPSGRMRYPKRPHGQELIGSLKRLQGPKTTYPTQDLRVQNPRVP